MMIEAVYFAAIVASVLVATVILSRRAHFNHRTRHDKMTMLCAARHHAGGQLDELARVLWLVEAVTYRTHYDTYLAGLNPLRLYDRELIVILGRYLESRAAARRVMNGENANARDL